MRLRPLQTVRPLTPLTVLTSGLAALTIACGSTPTTPTTSSIAAPPAVPMPSPVPVVTFSIDLPLDEADAANGSNGINPYGVHLADHGADGHPGWDIEFRPGASIRAAADGTIQTLFPDPDPRKSGRFTVQIMHTIGSRTFRTVYVNVDGPRAEIVVGAAIHAGEPIGLAGVITQMIGTGLVTSAGTHFQLDDFSYSGGLTNQNAVSPEAWLTPRGRALFETMWATASYTGELTEPSPTNSRDTAFPLTRRWTRQRGDLPAAIEFTRATGITNEYLYRLIGSNGDVVETGATRITPWTRPLTTIDFAPSNGGASRLGLYDVVSTTMRLALGAPGAARPGDFSGESVYLLTQ